ncbi:glycosyltransferase family 4 protein [Spirulina sp. CS-785/01]|uniref:glycosyltransferase family 4 protein n=1 Tax=Spirulina sp. CS-785/01 TaxID=3021716 RepID=UPI0023314504|nr:glycosyltransferase family 4 protein [Spirulina sp. CS-785/01]MDB9315913.1 glycosyltransferase family 4 protein [Spirulina sp. CS-785/01]
MEALNILISAYACRPNMGSEPGVGWNIVCELAKFHHLWVLTRQDNRPFIEAALPQDSPNLHFVYCDLPGSSLWKKGLGGVHLHYYLWQIRAYFVARQLYQEKPFALAHHVTYVRYSTPSFLSLLPIPLIWGPVGGGETAPRAFWQDFSFRAKVYEISRTLLRQLGEIDPFVRLTARRSRLAYATTPETAQRLSALGAKQVELLSQLGLSQAELAHFQKLSSTSISDKFRLVSIGRLLHWKGFYLGLRAFAQAQLPEAEYWIVGDGPERSHLQQLAQDLGIGEQVKFWGELPRGEAIAKLTQAHALVHPSLHDSGGGVCLEAMAVGRPVICLALGGPDSQVTEETGFKIPACTPEQATQDMAKAMLRLAQDPKLGQHLGQAGRQRVHNLYSWSQRGKTLANIYQMLSAETDNQNPKEVERLSR